MRGGRGGDPSTRVHRRVLSCPPGLPTGYPFWRLCGFCVLEVLLAGSVARPVTRACLGQRGPRAGRRGAAALTASPRRTTARTPSAWRAPWPMRWATTWAWTTTRTSPAATAPNLGTAAAASWRPASGETCPAGPRAAARGGVLPTTAPRLMARPPPQLRVPQEVQPVQPGGPGEVPGEAPHSLPGQRARPRPPGGRPRVRERLCGAWGAVRLWPAPGRGPAPSTASRPPPTSGSPGLHPTGRGALHGCGHHQTTPVP